MTASAPARFFAKPRLAVAFDLESKEEVHHWASSLGDLPIVIKLGLGILPALEPAEFARLRQRGFDLFIDVKLHDIPSQVARAVRRWSQLGANFITIHTSGGSQMIDEATRSVPKDGSCHLLGVTALTSLGEKHFREIGWESTNEAQVQRLCQLGMEHGLHGFVSSAAQVPQLKKLAQAAGKKLLSCTPGVTLPGEAAHFDQAQTLDLTQALDHGADLIVMGRSIMSAVNPREKCETALQLIDDWHRRHPH